MSARDETTQYGHSTLAHACRQPRSGTRPPREHTQRSSVTARWASLGSRQRRVLAAPTTHDTPATRREAVDSTALTNRHEHRGKQDDRKPQEDARDAHTHSRKVTQHALTRDSGKPTQILSAPPGQRPRDRATLRHDEEVATPERQRCERARQDRTNQPAHDKRPHGGEKSPEQRPLRDPAPARHEKGQTRDTEWPRNHAPGTRVHRGQYRRDNHQRQPTATPPPTRQRATQGEGGSGARGTRKRRWDAAGSARTGRRRSDLR